MSGDVKFTDFLEDNHLRGHSWIHSQATRKSYRPKKAFVVYVTGGQESAWFVAMRVHS